MAKTYHFHIIALLSLCLLGSCRGCFSPKEPEFIRMENITVSADSTGMLRATADAVFFNPNRVSATLLNTELDVSANEVKIADISQVNNTEIKAESNFTLPVLFNIDSKSLIYSQGISGLLNSALTRTIKLRFSGYCNIRINGGSTYKIPIETEQEIVVK